MAQHDRNTPPPGGAPGPQRGRGFWQGLSTAAKIGIGVGLGVLLTVCLCVFIAALGRGGGAPGTPTAVAGVSGTVTAALPAETATPATGPKPTAAPTTPLAAGVCSVGQRCEAGGISLTVNDVSKTDVVDHLPSTATPGSTFLVLDLTIENVTHEKVYYSPVDFKVRAADGTEYEPEIIADVVPNLQSGELAQGEHVRGNVAFEVPTSAGGLIVLYDPGFGYEVIRVNLGR